MAILPLESSVGREDDRAMTIEILLFDGFDDLDVFGPFEVLRTAGMQVRLVTVEDAATVTSAGGARIVPDGVLGDPELVLVPGGGWSDRSGPGAYHEAQRGVVTQRLAERHRRGGRVGSVCTGAMLLAEAGILAGRRAITHHGAIEDLRAAGADVQDGARFVDEGDIITSAGVTAGIDMALYLAGDQAELVAREIEWTQGAAPI